MHDYIYTYAVSGEEVDWTDSALLFKNPYAKVTLKLDKELTTIFWHIEYDGRTLNGRVEYTGDETFISEKGSVLAETIYNEFMDLGPGKLKISNIVKIKSPVKTESYEF